MKVSEIEAGWTYTGTKRRLRGSSAWREVVSVKAGRVLYLIGRSYGSDERECSVAAFAAWAKTRIRTGSIA